MKEKVIRKGGSFLLEDVPAKEVFTPEDFSEEHRMIIDTTERFVKNEVTPNIEKLEHKDWELSRKLMLQAGELGLLGAEIEDKYGGSQMDMITALLIVEHCSAAGSFGLTLNCHTGIGSEPLIYFGNKAQKEKYLPGIARGEKIGAYALTEPGAGTDARSIKATAKLSPDGKYYKLDGTKQFITNAGFADIIFTYAKVDGDKMTAFILERGYEGVSTGAEEKKMGLRGSSTCSIFFDGVKVVGVAKLALESAVKYSKERVQFNKPICQFGLIKHKIAEMATRIYVAESMIYRAGGLVEAILGTVDRNAEDASRRAAKSIQEYAVECSINKVYASEMLSYVADEAVQIYGGYGFIEEYPVERIHRDNRVFRIFEGTNEVNRLIITGWLMRQGLKNELPLFTAAQEAKEKLQGEKPIKTHAKDGALEFQHKLIGRAKQVFLWLCGDAAQKYGMAIEEQQEVMGLLADITQEIYAMESGLLRALKSIGSVGEKQSKTKIEMVRLYVNDAMVRIAGYARQVLAAMETGDTLDKQISVLNNALEFTPVDGVQLRRAIGDRIIEAEKYTC
ncbi:MAG: acyl-CoA dehydrogenase family protein [Chloroflexi bacterium]|nr:acyl-CoA dehydrogenase family protein [Chloroflexota bacterium]